MFEDAWYTFGATEPPRQEPRARPRRVSLLRKPDVESEEPTETNLINMPDGRPSNHLRRLISPPTATVSRRTKSLPDVYGANKPRFQRGRMRDGHDIQHNRSNRRHSEVYNHDSPDITSTGEDVSSALLDASHEKDM